MFTDAEIGLKMAHDRNIRAMTNEAQVIIDGQGNELARLRRQLAAAQRQGKDLLLERGRDRNEAIALRIAARN